MNQFLILFLLIAFAALTMRDLSKRKFPLWLIFAIYVVVGWGLANPKVVCRDLFLAVPLGLFHCSLFCDAASEIECLAFDS